MRFSLSGRDRVQIRADMSVYSNTSTGFGMLKLVFDDFLKSTSHTPVQDMAVNGRSSVAESIIEALSSMVCHGQSSPTWRQVVTRGFGHGPGGTGMGDLSCSTK